MRKVIDLSHRACDYNCMLSGLEDMTGQERGIRLPDYMPFLSGCIGFSFRVEPTGKIPRIAMPVYGVGKVHYSFLADILGFEWKTAMGEPFETAWDNIRRLIDKNHPVIAGELDMFHLPYLRKFYHRIHVPFHYVTLTGYDDEKETVILQDCGREETQEIPLHDLKRSLNQDIPGLCRRNTYYWFAFDKQIGKITTEGVIRKALNKCGSLYLKDGLPAFESFLNDFPGWRNVLSRRQLKKCLFDLVTYTCSFTPMPPQKLVFFRLEPIFLSHQAMRDRFAALLKAIGSEYGMRECLEASVSFETSGKLFQEATDHVTRYLTSIIKSKKAQCSLDSAAECFRQIAGIEETAFSTLSKIV